jgi:hypothetical protein
MQIQKTALAAKVATFFQWTFVLFSKDPFKIYKIIFLNSSACPEK